MEIHLGHPTATPDPARRTTTVPAAALAVLVSVVLGLAGPVAATLADPAVVDALEVEGRAIEVAADPSLDAAADRANQAGIAFAWLDRAGDDEVAIILADEYIEELGARGSPYQTVLVVVGNGFAASSLSRSQLDLDEALDAALPGFAEGDMTAGLDSFVATMASSGASAGDATTTATSEPSGSTTGSSDSGGGIGFGTILLVVALAGGGFLLVGRILLGRREREQAEIDLAEDRAEIEDELKNIADRVIALGDRVIAGGDQELI